MWSELLPSRLRTWRETRRALREMNDRQALDDSLAALDDNNALYRAKVAVQVGDKDAALNFWLDARRRFPSYTLRSRDSIDVLLQLRRFDEAESLMLEGQKQFPQEGYYFEGYARVAQEQGNMPEAVERWASVRKQFPFRWRGFAFGADCLANFGNLTEASTLLDIAVVRFPAEIGCHLSYARIAERLQDWPEAVRRWEHVLEEFRHVAGISGAARALHEMGRTDEAVARLETMRPLYPTEVEIVVLMAQLEEARGDQGKAEQRWRFVRERFPLSAIGYKESARVLERLGRADDADTALRAAIDRFDRDAWPLVEYASIAQKRGDAAEAAKRWEAVRTAFPDREDGYLCGADALAVSGSAEEATKVRAEHRTRFNR
jgi:tetratricopeptide (TPR) repeat protein